MPAAWGYPVASQRGDERVQLASEVLLQSASTHSGRMCAASQPVHPCALRSLLYACCTQSGRYSGSLVWASLTSRRRTGTNSARCG
jgi:hypothetical protein